MNKIKLYIASIIALFGMSAFALAPVSVYAATSAKDAVCEGAQFASGGSCDTAAAGGTIKGVIKMAIEIFQIIVGIISVFTLITAGLNYVTSAGDGAKTKTAKDRILYSAIGLIVVVLAQVIVSFVLNRVNGQTGL